MMRIAGVFSLFAILSMAGCGKADIGEQCDQTSDCNAGLQCILDGSQHVGASGLQCTTNKLCSTPCSTDADCAPLGGGVICVSECNAGSCLRGSRQ